MAATNASSTLVATTVDQELAPKISIDLEAKRRADADRDAEAEAARKAARALAQWAHHLLCTPE